MEQENAQQTKPSKVKTLFRLFLTYLKIGLFTFGGGYAMIALIEDEIVRKKQWISKTGLTDIVTIAESTPGPIAINCATYVGYKIGGFFGSCVATLGVVIPSFVIIFVISLFFDAFLALKYVAYAFLGIKCAVGLIILSTGLKMFKELKKTPLNIILLTLAIAGILVVNLFALNFSTVFFILIGAVIGLIVYAIALGKQKRQAKEQDLATNDSAESENATQVAQNSEQGGQE